MAEVSSPPAQEAGWLAREEAGDERNQGKANVPDTGHSIGSTTEMVKTDLDECSKHRFSGPLSPDQRKQRMKALEGANASRFTRSRIRGELISGARDFDSFLDEMPASCAKMSLLKVLQWLPNIGITKAERIVSALPDTNLGVLLKDLAPKAKYILSSEVARVAVARNAR